VAGHHGESLGGMVASLVTFPDHGIAIAVTSNISGPVLPAVKLAQAFAEPVGVPK
jgi:hypothetical protein